MDYDKEVENYLSFFKAFHGVEDNRSLYIDVVAIPDGDNGVVCGDFFHHKTKELDFFEIRLQSGRKLGATLHTLSHELVHYLQALKVEPVGDEVVIDRIESTTGILYDDDYNRYYYSREEVEAREIGHYTYMKYKGKNYERRS